MACRNDKESVRKRDELKAYVAELGEKKKAHTINKEDYGRVIKYAMIGLDADTIAYLIGCTTATIWNSYQEALKEGRSQAHAAIATRIFDMAMSGDKTMLTFYAKTKLKWSERYEITGADGTPLSVFVDKPAEKLSREEWLAAYNKKLPTEDDDPSVIN